MKEAHTMQRVFEIDTWRGNKELNETAIAAAKAYDGRKFTVAIGEWGVKTYLTFADSKEEAKALALAAYDGGAANWHDEKIQCREVTNCKKYQKD